MQAPGSSRAELEGGPRSPPTPPCSTWGLSLSLTDELGGGAEGTAAVADMAPWHCSPRTDNLIAGYPEASAKDATYAGTTWGADTRHYAPAVSRAPTCPPL